MRVKAASLVAAALMATASVACAAVSYSTNFATDVSADFGGAPYKTVAPDGYVGGVLVLPDANVSVNWTAGNLKLYTQWNRAVGYALRTAGEANNGVFDNATASMTFRLAGSGATFGGDTKGVSFGLGMHTNPVIPNPYTNINCVPGYFLLWNRANQTLVMMEDIKAAAPRQMAVSDVLTLSTTAEFDLQFAVSKDTATGTLNFTGKLWQNDVLLTTLTGTDTTATNDGTYDSNGTGASLIDQTQTGLVSLQSSTGGTGGFRGLDISHFEVMVPEPGMAGVLVLSAVLCGLGRRARSH